jgi:hypothetical protein
MLALEIGELGEAGFDLNLAGFDEFELGELFPRGPKVGPIPTMRLAEFTRDLAPGRAGILTDVDLTE